MEPKTGAKTEDQEGVAVDTLTGGLGVAAIADIADIAWIYVLEGRRSRACLEEAAFLRGARRPAQAAEGPRGIGPASAPHERGIWFQGLRRFWVV